MKKEVIIDDTDAVIDETTEKETGADGKIIDETRTDVFQLPEGATQNADGTVTLRLQTPVSVKIKKATGEIRSETYSSLTLRPFTGADLRAIQSTSAEMQNIVTFSRAAGIREVVMNSLYDRMNATDIIKAAEIMNAFMNGGRPKK